MLLSKDPASVIEECENRFKDCQAMFDRHREAWKEYALHTNPPLAAEMLEAEHGKSGYNPLLDYRNIINNTPIMAARTHVQGYTSTALSPNTPWFEFTPSSQLEDDDDMKFVAHESTEVLRRIFMMSNFYTAIETLIAHITVIGTALMYVFPHEQNIVHFQVATPGTFRLTIDDAGDVRGAYREFMLTVRQMVSKFGLENVSDTVRDQYELKNYGQKHTIIHVCDETMGGLEDVVGRDMPYMSVYYERRVKSDKESAKFLRATGHKERPFVAPRGDVYGSTPYGTPLAAAALPDCKQLFHLENMAANIVQQAAYPDLMVDISLKQHVRGLRNRIIFKNPSQNERSIEQVVTHRQDASALIESEIMKCEQRIEAAFYADIFLIITSNSQKNVTATAIDEQREEKLLMLGTLHERMSYEGFNRIIRLTRNIAAERQVVPPLPDGVSFENLDIQYTSKLAQALRVYELTKIERAAGFIGNLAAVKPTVADKFDEDRAVDEYGRSLNLDPEIIRSTDEVMDMRKAREQQAQAQQMMEQMPQAANAAKVMSETDMRNNDSLLAGLIGG